jgi:hypothetical protein
MEREGEREVGKEGRESLPYWLRLGVISTMLMLDDESIKHGGTIQIRSK